MYMYYSLECCVAIGGEGLGGVWAAKRSHYVNFVVSAFVIVLIGLSAWLALV